MASKSGGTRNRSLGGEGPFTFSIPYGFFETRARELNGRFTKLKVEFRRAYENSAIELQRLEVLYLKESLEYAGKLRPQRPTEYLVHALADPRNRRVNEDGFVVNPPDWLESNEAHVAPYYRNLEEGTHIFVGRAFRGFFLTSEGKPIPADAGRYRVDPRLVQLGPAGETTSNLVGHPGIVDGTEGGQFGDRPGNFLSTAHGKNPLRSRLLAQELSTSGGAEFDGQGRGHPLTRIIRIHNPILPHHFFQKAIEEFRDSGYLEDEIEYAAARADLREIFIAIGKL